MKKILLTFLALTLAAGIAKTVFASNDRLPETMKSQTTAQQNSINYYGGFTGNEAVYNYTNSTTGAGPSGPSGQMEGIQFNGSLHFDGHDDYVNIPNVNTGSSMTVSMWLNAQDWFDLDPPAGNMSHWLVGASRFGIASWKTRFINFVPALNVSEIAPVHVVQDPANRSRYYCDLDPDASAKVKNTWNFITMTYDQSNGELRNYINGTFINSCTFKGNDGAGAYPPIQASSGAVNIGSSGDDNYAGNGFIDEVKIYNRPLNITDIASSYRGTYNDTSGLMGYWNFNERSGTLLYDQTSNNNNGTLTNMDDPPSAISGWDLYNSPFPTTTSGSSGNDLFGFDKDSLVGTVDGCINDIVFLRQTTGCFFSNSRNTNVKVASSRTYVNADTNKKPVMEMAALYYPPAATIVGDAYLGNLDLGNFAYWGRNLTLTPSEAGTNQQTFWGQYHYTNGPLAQANLTGTEYTKYVNKVKEMAGEATQVQAGALNSQVWRLQGSVFNGASNDEVNKYPQGKIWHYDANKSNTLTLASNTTYTYYGKGTIIIHDTNPNPATDPGPDLKFLNGAKLVPGDLDSQLGIILMDGNHVYLEGNNKVQAAILCYTDLNTGGNIQFDGNNVDLIGSFVAHNYPGLTGAGSKFNIRFYYDKKLDSSWPPGFRYLNMPHPTEN